jgi:DNA-binding transcriptional ArsR family regulator
MLDYQDAKKVAAMLSAVGEPTRMMILHQLTDGPSHVGRLAELVGVPMVNISHHLGVMRQAGLLTDTKDGRRVIYSFHPEVYTPGGPGGAVATLNFGPYKLYILNPNGDGKKKSDGKKKK